ncbi:RNA polymerase II transcription factor B subunit [Parastagonospora nodorum]|nr:RNA polymerase II transcription factor B subunit [Parastagonospora nodorum]KAH4227159.1 RNA polymerase II transcription factor B subunit [Parastagonospora nodorum]KAH4233895.1 RNA polymerase II transcription factor B subunit [Parastagonospora nodorum]KAH4340566.1 RNA polymerase II transcription factor B subunit [Parastagonospora nodorum]KAH4367564.1 RNA polymerase II transcription factor B subunit [Parastagonospora nodorum]
MSKQAGRANGASTKRLAEDGDICPVCKSSRYLNPNMKFKVNPECYHKMCESCVDRIFSHGPAPCPIAGCARTLRKAKFRTQTFEDLKVEREVDIRRRVASAMNKKEDDFETLKDYNDYLEEVETITWNLILKVDVDATESRLRRWEEHQKAELNPNAIRRDYDTVPTDHVVLKKGGTQRKTASSTNTLRTVGEDLSEDTGFHFHGLKKRVAPPPEAPFDPFGGWSIVPQYYSLQDNYDVDWLTKQKNDMAHTVGGYDMQDFFNRSLRDAFGGFGVFIEEEMNVRGVPSGNANIATERAVAAAKDVDMDDVF